jgi:hypothetical protein
VAYTLRRFVVEAKKQRLQFKKLSIFFPEKLPCGSGNDFNSLRTTGPFSHSTFGFFAINPPFDPHLRIPPTFVISCRRISSYRRRRLREPYGIQHFYTFKHVASRYFWSLRAEKVPSLEDICPFFIGRCACKPFEDIWPFAIG